MSPHPTPSKANVQYTPKTPGASLKTCASLTSTPSHLSSSYRLLYRGALSLPDSHLLLDGLTFFARLDSPAKRTKSLVLLDNPLPLALESMRGRPSLRFMGIVKLDDFYLDEAGNVEMDIHPRAMLTRIYFENMFCLKPLAKPLSSHIGIRVALGDSDGPETTQIIISARLDSTEVPSNIRFSVGRIAPRPQPQKRVPRPDDPIPRKPPTFFLQKTESKGLLLPNGVTKRVSELKRHASTNELKRSGSSSSLSMGPSASGSKRMKLVGSSASANDVFKVPEVPMKAKTGKGKEKDVFGDVAEVNGAAKPPGKGPAVDPVDAAREKTNKNEIKRATMTYLAKTKDPTRLNIPFDKKHPEFKELYNMLHRGIIYALRNRMTSEYIDATTIDRLLAMHADMYITGCGLSNDLPTDATRSTGPP